MPSCVADSRVSILLISRRVVVAPGRRFLMSSSMRVGRTLTMANSVATKKAFMATSTTASRSARMSRSMAGMSTGGYRLGE